MTNILRKFLSGVALVAMVGVMALPSAISAQVTSSGAVVNFSGKITSIDASTNTVVVNVQWLYGVAGASNSTTGQSAILPVAYHFCSGTSIPVVIPSGVKIYSGNTQISLSQVPVGAYFNATVSYQNGVALAQVVRIINYVPVPPVTPVGFVPPVITSLPTGTGVVNFAGRVSTVNPSANSISAQVQWFYGASSDTSGTVGLAAAAHLCPTSLVTINVTSATRLLSFNGRTITLSQVPAGSYFNASVAWQNGVFTATTLRFTMAAQPIPAATTEPVPTTTVTTSGSVPVPPPAATPNCGFWSRLFGTCITTTTTTAPVTVGTTTTTVAVTSTTSVPVSGCGFWASLFGVCQK
jgi:hypothetical protein